MTTGSSWELAYFEDRFDAWAGELDPHDELCVTIMDWIMTRAVDPYHGAEQDPDRPGMWFAWIPDSDDGCGNRVACRFQIDPLTHTVTCDIIESRRW